MILGRFWDDLKTMLGRFWNEFGIILRRFCEDFPYFVGGFSGVFGMPLLTFLDMFEVHVRHILGILRIY